VSDGGPPRNSNDQLIGELIGELAAERVIGRVLLEYGRGVDTGDFERVRACFHEDATITYGARSAGQRDEVIAWLAKVKPLMEAWSHYFGPPVIDLDLESGTAECETWCINVLSFQPDELGARRQQVLGLLYTDRFTRRTGEWRIAERRNESEWSFDPHERSRDPQGKRGQREEGAG
jgi:hypothetical protein